MSNNCTINDFTNKAFETAYGLAESVKNSFQGEGICGVDGSQNLPMDTDTLIKGGLIIGAAFLAGMAIHSAFSKPKVIKEVVVERHKYPRTKLIVDRNLPRIFSNSSFRLQIYRSPFYMPL